MGTKKLKKEEKAPLKERIKEYLRLPASGFRLPASGFRLPASGFRLPASGFRLP
jgi:hypothetical protein